MSEKSIKLEKNQINLYRQIRKGTCLDRLELLNQLNESLENPLDNKQEVEWLDSMIENGVGITPIPLGIITNARINGVNYCLPLATEEPSVIAAAHFASSFMKEGQGIIASSSEPILAGAVYIKNPNKNCIPKLEFLEDHWKELLTPLLENMTSRGGGWRKIEYDFLTDPFTQDSILKVRLTLATCNAMGANLMNSALEFLTPYLLQESEGTLQMAILTNRNVNHVVKAEYSMSLGVLHSNIVEAKKIAQRIVQNYHIALMDEERAVTHNKGVMNGITALSLATGNDTRAVEAGVHSWASSRECFNFHQLPDNNFISRYLPVTSYHLKGDNLVCRIQLPLALATVGGGVGQHTSYRWALEQLSVSSSQELREVTAALGLLQNFAALRALSYEGIQKGHMSLHKKRQ